MNQYENLSPEQADVVMNMMISDQKRARFEVDRKKRILQLQTLPKRWKTFLVIAGLITLGIGLFFEIRIWAIFIPILFLSAITQEVWRYQSRHLVNSLRNERFEP